MNYKQTYQWLVGKLPIYQRIGAAAYKAILEGEDIKKPTIPASFRLLVNELRALGLNMDIKKEK